MDVAIAASGEALVTWTENETLAALGRARARVLVARRAPGRNRRFGRPVELSRGQAGAHDPELDMTAGGEAVAVWEQLRASRRGTSPLRISAALRPAGGRLRRCPWRCSDTQRGFRAFPGPLLLEGMVPRVAVLPSGAALAVWERASGAARACCQRVEAAIRPARRRVRRAGGADRGRGGQARHGPRRGGRRHRVGACSPTTTRRCS